VELPGAVARRRVGGRAGYERLRDGDASTRISGQSELKARRIERGFANSRDRFADVRFHLVCNVVERGNGALKGIGLRVAGLTEKVV
jgi:hypothetical protein